MNNNHKVALLSHVLPPSASGQAMVIYRLFNNVSPDKYCLLSRENYEGIDRSLTYSRKLSGKYYYLNPIPHLPIIKHFKLHILSNIITAPWVYLRRVKQIYEVIKKEKCNMLIACTGDLYDLPAAYLASKMTRVTFVIYLFDDYAYQWTGRYRSISKRLEPIVIKHAKAVIVPNEYMQKEYIKRYNVYCTVIRNPSPLPDLDELDSVSQDFNDKEINIVYTGSIYHAHYDAFHNLIAAIKLMQREDVKLHIYAAQTESELKRNGISGTMVKYHHHIRESEVLKVLRQGDILFLPLAFNSTIPEVIKTSAPGKTGEYLSVGRPILVHAPQDSFVSWYFRKNRCGMVVDKNDHVILAEEINKLVSNEQMQADLSKSARKVAERDFSLEKIKTVFLEFINSL